MPPPITYTIPKLPAFYDATRPPLEAEAIREGMMWVDLCRAKQVNADLIQHVQHTVTEYVWVIRP